MLMLLSMTRLLDGFGLRLGKAHGIPLTILELGELLQGCGMIGEEIQPSSGIFLQMNGVLMDAIIDPIRSYLKLSGDLRQRQIAWDASRMGLMRRAQQTVL